MKTYRIAAIPGDGIGNEVIPAGIDVLEHLEDGFQLEFEHFDWSSKRFQDTGDYIPEGGLEKLKRFDAIFFGAVGDPDLPDDLTLWGLRLAICQGFDQYANVRPIRLLPGIRFDVDWSWAGAFAGTEDGLPYIGVAPEFPNGYVALGHGANGVVFAYIAARLLLDTFVGRTNPDLEIFRVGR